MCSTQSSLAGKLLARRSLHAVSYGMFIFLSLGRLLSSDCFLDGVVYSAIARNLALGVGTFWRPSYTVQFTPFYEHPPFALWCESLAFRLAGDKPWVESTWGILLGLLTLGVIGVIWQTVQHSQNEAMPPDHSALPGAWWPLMLTVLSPLVSWCFTNNLLENTLAPLVLLAACLLLKAYWSRKAVHVVLWGGGSGLCVWLALLTKGPPALFVMVLPFFAFVCFPGVPFRRFLAVTGAMLLVILACAAVFLLADGNGMRDFLNYYLKNQIQRSAHGLRELAPNQAFLLWVLMRELTLPAIVVLGVVLGCRHCSGKNGNFAWRWATFFGGAGLSGSLPFLLFPKQMEWYLMPSIPFFALALASCSVAAAVGMEKSLGSRKEAVFLVHSLAVTFVVMGVLAATVFRGTLRVSLATSIRDQYRQVVEGRLSLDWQSEYTWQVFSEEVIDQGVLFPKGAQVSFCPDEIHDKWRLTAYLQRSYQASLSPLPGNDYLIIGPSSTPCCISTRYRALQRKPGNYFKIYQKQW